MYRRSPTLLAALAAALLSTPISAAAAAIPDGAMSRDWGDDPPRRGGRWWHPRRAPRIGFRPAARWVPNLTDGMHWEKGIPTPPAGRGAHRKRGEFKAAQRAKRKAKSAKRADAFLRRNHGVSGKTLRQTVNIVRERFSRQDRTL